jgi:WD40 repeat protein
MTGDEGITAVKIWDVGIGGGAEWANVPAAAERFNRAAFTPDGASVATGAGDGTVALWDTRTGERRSALRAQGAGAIDISRDGRLAAAGPARVHVWDLDSRRERFAIEVPEAADVAWSPDGSVLATAAGSGTVRIADRSGKELGVLGDDPPLNITAVRFSPDARLLAVAALPASRPTAQGEVVVWDWRRNAVERVLPTRAGAVAFSSDGRLIAAAAVTGPVVVYEARTGRVVAPALRSCRRGERRRVRPARVARGDGERRRHRPAVGRADRPPAARPAGPRQLRLGRRVQP